MPKISVIIPIYGVEKYIERCARSLFEQSLDDIEFLFIDDCTPDKSVEILKNVLEEYKSRSSQVIIHRMEHNSGQAKVREWGMQHATGDYLIHCDTDDWPDLQQYETMYNAASKLSADLVFCDYNRVYPNGILEYHDCDTCYDNKHELFRRMLIGYYDINPLWKCLMKRDLIQSIVYPKGNQGEDRVIMFQAIFYSSKIIHLKQALYNYYITPNSIVRSVEPGKLLQRASDTVANVNTLLAFMKDKQLYCQYEDEIVYSKFEPRLLLFAGIYNKECRVEWNKVFPEINSLIFNNGLIPTSFKMKEVLMRMHLGKAVGLFIRALHRVRLNKRER